MCGGRRRGQWHRHQAYKIEWIMANVPFSCYLYSPLHRRIFLSVDRGAWDANMANFSVFALKYSLHFISMLAFDMRKYNVTQYIEKLMVRVKHSPTTVTIYTYVPYTYVYTHIWKNLDLQHNGKCHWRPTKECEWYGKQRKIFAQNNKKNERKKNRRHLTAAAPVIAYIYENIWIRRVIVVHTQRAAQIVVHTILVEGEPFFYAKNTIHSRNIPIFFFIITCKINYFISTNDYVARPSERSILCYARSRIYTLLYFRCVRRPDIRLHIQNPFSVHMIVCKNNNNDNGANTFIPI